GLLAERVLATGRFAPLPVQSIEVLLATCEEAVARGAELLPQGLRVLRGSGTDRLPFGLQALHEIGRLVPGRRLADVRHLGAERALLLEVLRHVAVRAAAELVPRRAEAFPERLRLVGRGARHRRPLVLQVGEDARALRQVVRLEQRLDATDDLFLRRDVGPAPPLLGFLGLTMVLQEPIACRRQPLGPGGASLGRRQRTQLLERRLDRLELAAGRAGLERFGGRELLEAVREGGEARHVFVLLGGARGGLVAPAFLERGVYAALEER